jgi:hypothetical protein
VAPVHVLVAADIEGAVVVTGFEFTGAGHDLDSTSALMDGAVISLEAANWLY